MQDEQRVTNLDIMNSLKNHFIDDAVAFKGIEDRLKKSDGIAISNGRQVDLFRKELTEVNGKMDKLIDKIEQNDEKLTKHITAVTPILKIYEDNQTTMRTVLKFVRPIVAVVVTLASFIGATYVIINFLTH